MVLFRCHVNVSWIDHLCCICLFRMRVKKLPQILALHLKRFKYMEHLNRYIKVSYRVVFPLELRLFNTVSVWVVSLLTSGACQPCVCLTHLCWKLFSVTCLFGWFSDLWVTVAVAVSWFLCFPCICFCFGYDYENSCDSTVTPVPSRTFSWAVTLAWPDPAPAAPAPFINNWCFNTACLLTGWPCCGKRLPSIWLVFLNHIVLTAALHVYSIRTINEL